MKRKFRRSSRTVEQLCVEALHRAQEQCAELI